MKVKVLIDFRDRHTKQMYRKGDVIEVTAERAAEMNTAHSESLVSAVESKKPTKGKKKEG